MYVVPFISSLFFVVFLLCIPLFVIVHPSLLCLFVLVVGFLKEGTFAGIGPAWPGTLAPERQVQGVWGAGSPPGNIDITSYGLTRRLKETPPEKKYIFSG